MRTCAHTHICISNADISFEMQIGQRRSNYAALRRHPHQCATVFRELNNSLSCGDHKGLLRHSASQLSPAAHGGVVSPLGFHCAKAGPVCSGEPNPVLRINCAHPTVLHQGICSLCQLQFGFPQNAAQGGHRKAKGARTCWRQKYIENQHDKNR